MSRKGDPYPVRFLIVDNKLSMYNQKRHFAVYSFINFIILRNSNNIAAIGNRQEGESKKEHKPETGVWGRSPHKIRRSGAPAPHKIRVKPAPYGAGLPLQTHDHIFRALRSKFFGMQSKLLKQVTIAKSVWVKDGAVIKKRGYGREAPAPHQKPGKARTLRSR